MRFDSGMRRVLQALFGGPFRPEAPRTAPDNSRFVIHAQHISTPQMLIRCPMHSNPTLASVVGLLGTTKGGHVAVERVA